MPALAKMIRRPVVHILTGLPASGKSTKAYELLAAGRGRTRRVNMDDIRAMLDQPGPGQPRMWSYAHEQTALAVQDAAIRETVLGGWDLVVDNCHLTPHMPERIKNAVGALAFFIVHDLTDVPVEECIRRDADRPEPVGVDVIRGLAGQAAEATAAGWRLTDQWMNDQQDTTTGSVRWARTYQHVYAATSQPEENPR